MSDKGKIPNSYAKAVVADDKVKSKDIPDSEVEVKLGVCPKCKRTVSAAVWHMLGKKERNDWMKEAVNDNLDTKTVMLLEYRKDLNNWGCKCDVNPRKK